MTVKTNLKTVSDDELLRGLFEILKDSRHAEADLVARIAEVDARRLYAREAASSMYTYCTEVLHLSEAEAWIRIRVARASRRHPMLLTMLRDGRLHLSGIVVMAPHLTVDNRDALLKRATHQPKRRIEELVAELAPQDDAPAGIRKLPARREQTGPVAAHQLTPESVGRTDGGAHPAPTSPVLDLRPAAAVPDRRAATVQPLSPDRFKVQFTADAELRDMLKRLQALMRSSMPEGDLVDVLKVAVAEKIERLEAKRFGKTKAPRKGLADTDSTPRTRHIPAAVRRSVHERDGGRCTYQDKRGKRCSKRHDLEFHHRKPFGRGGLHSPEVLTLHCRVHNALMAEHDYGREKMARFRNSASRVSERRAVYGATPAPARGKPPGRHRQSIPADVRGPTVST